MVFSQETLDAFRDKGLHDLLVALDRERAWRQRAEPVLRSAAGVLEHMLSLSDSEGWGVTDVEQVIIGIRALLEGEHDR